MDEKEYTKFLKGVIRRMKRDPWLSLDFVVHEQEELLERLKRIRDEGKK